VRNYSGCGNKSLHWSVDGDKGKRRIEIRSVSCTKMLVLGKRRMSESCAVTSCWGFEYHSIKEVAILVCMLR
jgi:hypothetical protein